MPDPMSEQQVERLKALLNEAMNYAHHIPGCDYRGGEGICDCGLRDLEAALKELR